MDSKDPADIHNAEQMEAACRELAGLVRAYHRSLVLEGFTIPQAMELTTEFQKSLVAYGGMFEDEDD